MLKSANDQTTTITKPLEHAHGLVSVLWGTVTLVEWIIRRPMVNSVKKHAISFVS